MSDRLFQRANGTYCFASTNTEWHRFGQLASGPMRGHEALSLSTAEHLEFVVAPDPGAIFPVPTPDNPNRKRLGNMSEYKAVALWDKESDILYPAVPMSKSRKLFQPADTVEAMDLLLDVSEGTIETFGLFDDRATWFATVKMPEEVTIGGDKHLIYAFARDSLNSAFRVDATSIRVVCSNTFWAAVWAIRNSERTGYYLPHTVNARISIQGIREALELVYNTVEFAQRFADSLADEPMSFDQFKGFAAEWLGEPDKDASRITVRNHTRKVNSLATMFDNAPYSETLASTLRKGLTTRWTAMQTVGEWLDHFAPVKDKNKDFRRMEKSLTGANTADLKRALALLK